MRRASTSITSRSRAAAVMLKKSWSGPFRVPLTATGMVSGCAWAIESLGSFSGISGRSPTAKISTFERPSAVRIRKGYVPGAASSGI